MYSSGLLPHQIEDARRLLDLLQRNGSACDRSEMGTGKSYTAAGVARTLGLETIVICPKATIPQWSHVLSQFPGDNRRTILNYESVRLGKLPCYKPKSGWSRERPLLIIFDEAHRTRGRNTQTSKILRHAREAGHKILLLSATLITSVLDLSTIGYALGLFLDPRSWWSYARRFGGFLNGFNAYDYSRSPRHLVSLNTALDMKGVRTTISDLGQDLPCVTVPELVKFPSVERINREYEKLVDTLMDEMEHGAQMAARLVTRMAIELEKAKHFANETEDLVANGYSVVIFVNFTETIYQLVSQFQKHPGIPNVSVVMGGQTPAARQANVDWFNTNKTNILIANIKAGGVGLSLHDTEGNHPRVALISPPESAIDLIQCLGRIRRVGMASSAANRILFAAGTIEEKVFRNVSKKVHAIDTLNDGDLDPVTLPQLSKHE